MAGEAGWDQAQAARELKDSQDYFARNGMAALQAQAPVKQP
jgi:hypothetical protein